MNYALRPRDLNRGSRHLIHIKLSQSELSDQSAADKARGAGDRDAGLSMPIQLLNHPNAVINHDLCDIFSLS
jgi:hypothetical protein